MQVPTSAYLCRVSSKIKQVHSSTMICHLLYFSTQVFHSLWVPQEPVQLQVLVSLSREQVSGEQLTEPPAPDELEELATLDEEVAELPPEPLTLVVESLPPPAPEEAATSTSTLGPQAKTNIPKTPNITFFIFSPAFVTNLSSSLMVLQDADVQPVRPPPGEAGP